MTGPFFIAMKLPYQVNHLEIMAIYWEMKKRWHLAVFQISYPRKWQLIRSCPIGILGLRGSHQIRFPSRVVSRPNGADHCTLWRTCPGAGGCLPSHGGRW